MNFLLIKNEQNLRTNHSTNFDLATYFKYRYVIAQINLDQQNITKSIHFSFHLLFLVFLLSFIRSIRKRNGGNRQFF